MSGAGRNRLAVECAGEGAGEGEVQQAAQEAARYLLARGAGPVRRAELVRHVGAACSLPPARAGAALAQANLLLKQVYGYKMVQVEARGGVQYILVLTEDSLDSIPSPVTEAKHRIMLTAALTHIFMSGGTVNEDDMWKFLEKAGLLDEGEQAGKKILTQTFTKQLYLTYTKEGEGELARNIFQWGQRASEETTKMFMLQKTAEAFEKAPDYWYEQHREATGEERGTVAVE